MRKFLKHAGTLIAVGLIYSAVLFFRGEPIQAQQGGGFANPKLIQFTCSTACNISGLKVGYSAIVISGSSTSRTSSTTFSADTNLQFTNVPAGAYVFSAYLTWTDASAGGAQWTFVNTGGGTSTGVIGGTQMCNEAQGATATSAWGTTTTFNALCSTHATSVDTASMYGAVVYNPVVSSTLSLTWAQNTSNATSSTLASGNVMTVTRIN
jgi:hypothetical protein